MQSHKHSIYEAIINALIGFAVSFAFQLIIYPAYGAQFTLMDNLHIGILFTIISFIRSYLVRRYFNQMIVKAAHKMAGD